MHGIGTRRAIADEREQSLICELQEIKEGRVDACGLQDRLRSSDCRNAVAKASWARM